MLLFLSPPLCLPLSIAERLAKSSRVTMTLKWARPLGGDKRPASRFVRPPSLRQRVEFHWRVQSCVVLTDIEVHLLFVVSNIGLFHGWVGAVDFETETQGEISMNLSILCCLSSLSLVQQTFADDFSMLGSEGWTNRKPKISTLSAKSLDSSFRFIVIFFYFNDYLDCKLSLNVSKLWMNT